MSKEKEILDSIKLQLQTAIDDATDVDVTDGTEQIYEGRKELAEQILNYLEENNYE
ncbi:MAG: hypothetical protein VW270_07140 [Candidatus Poseidoniales archaeon]